jgi:cyclic pyranopterin phosphate synthase
MVNVAEKSVTTRTARARGKIFMSAEALRMVESGGGKKGDVFGASRIAGIMAVKNTAFLIPLCHPLAVDFCSIEFTINSAQNYVEVECSVQLTAKTGAEMEALTGASIALLTIYDMCKSVDRAMTLGEIRLVEKSGGKSGLFVRENEPVQ